MATYTERYLLKLLSFFSCWFSQNVKYWVYSTSDLCFSADRQRGRVAGFSLYTSKSNVYKPSEIKRSTLCYKSGPWLPPLNFTEVCMEYGRYVIFYNERLDGVIYPKGYEIENVFTEVCEVVVQGKEINMHCLTWLKMNTCINHLVNYKVNKRNWKVIECRSSVSSWRNDTNSPLVT